MKYQVLTDAQGNQLAQIEGNSVGSGILPQLIDQALVGAAAASSAGSAAAAAQSTANAALPAAKLVARVGSVAGGSATPTATVSGLLTTDTILAVTQSGKGANGLPLLGFASTVVTANQLPLVYSADPGAGGAILVLVKTA